LANHALAILPVCFRYGTISYHGAFVSISSIAAVQALPVDPKYWRRLRKTEPVIYAQAQVSGLDPAEFLAGSPPIFDTN
jgi:hypothetical protein